MQPNQAVVVDASRTLSILAVPEPEPGVDDAIVEVEALSLNRGEVRRSLTRASPGWRPGWDIAGRVVRAASNGRGPGPGDRVVGVLPASGGWARRIAAPVGALAVIPDSVSTILAACLPVAGLTALHALGKGGDLIGRKVLITGATGGVGHFACQLARAGGAHVVAAVRSETQAAFAVAHGAHSVIATGDAPGAVVAEGPFDLIVESVGGASLEAALGALAPGGTCVTIGVSSGAAVSFDAEAFFYSSASLTGLVLFRELETGDGAARGLERLLRLVADGRLAPHIAEVCPWTNIDAAARDLLERKQPGKIVLTLGDAS